LSEGRKTETEPQSTKKKTMKTITEKKTKSGLTSRPEPRSTEMQMQFDFTPRGASRVLVASNLLALIHLEAPMYFAQAELWGRWAWIQFRNETPTVTRIVIELGLLWNKARRLGAACMTKI